MTFSTDIVGNGRGKLALRLVVEGWPDEWITDARMAGERSDGRMRRDGLMYRGIKLSERTSLKDGKLDLSSFSVTIRSEHASRSFAYEGRPVGRLLENVDENDTDWIVSGLSSSDFGRYHVGTEVVSLSGAGSGGSGVNMVRRAWQTLAQAHRIASGIESTVVQIFDHPRTMEGRRAYLYAHTPEEFDLEDEGELLWRGVVSAPPRLTSSDGLSWSIGIDPITTLMDQEIAALQEEPQKAVGIVYHSKAPFSLSVIQSTNEEFQGDQMIVEHTASITGYFGDDEEFLQAIRDQLDDWNIEGVESIEVRRGMVDPSDPQNFLSGMSEDGITFTLTFPNTSPRYTVVLGESAMDGAASVAASRYLITLDENADLFFGVRLPIAIEVVSGAQYHTYVDATSGFGYSGIGALHPRIWAGGGSLNPRTTIVHVEDRDNPGTINVIPLQREYGALEKVRLTNVISLHDAVTARNRGGQLDPVDLVVDVLRDDVVLNGVIPAIQVAPPDEQVWRVRGLNDLSGAYVSDRWFVTPDTEIVPIHNFTGAARLDDMIEGVTEKSVNANFGNTPFVTDEDIDHEEIGSVLDGMSLPGWMTVRHYEYAEPVKLSDVLSHEFIMLGVIPRLNASGKMSVQRLTLPTDTLVGSESIGPDDILTPAGNSGEWIQWTPRPDGLVNVIEFHAGYDHKTAEHVGDIFRVRDAVSLSTHKMRGRGELKIAPLSTSVTEALSGIGGSAGITYEHIVGIAQRIFSWMARDYSVVPIPVTYRKFASCRVGDPVTVTSPHILNPRTGEMGVDGRGGIVIGRETNLDPSSNDMMMLEVLMHHSSEVAGYAPAMRVTGATHVSANTWDLSVESNRYAPTGDNDSDFFEPGNFVEIVEVDSTSPSTQTGTIESMQPSDVVRVSFDGAAPWGGSFSGSWDLEFQEADGGSAVSDWQGRFAYVADDSLSLYDGDSARVLA